MSGEMHHQINLLFYQFVSMNKFKSLLSILILNYAILVIVPFLLTSFIINTSSISDSQFLYIFNIFNSWGLSAFFDLSDLVLLILLLVFKLFLILIYVYLIESKKIILLISILLLILSICAWILQIFFSFAT
jgi:hypothetical protein